MKKTPRTSRCPPPQFDVPIGEWADLPLTLTTETVCCLLRCSDETAIKRLKEGCFCGRQIGKSYIFDRDSVRDYITGGKEEPSCVH